MPKLVVEHHEHGVYVYRESDEHHAVVEPNRLGYRRTAESLDDECSLLSGEYVVIEMSEAPISLDDKRRHAEQLLLDKEWSQRSDNWIGKVVGLNGKTVGKYRKQLLLLADLKEPEYRAAADGPRYPRRRKKSAVAVEREHVSLWPVVLEEPPQLSELTFSYDVLPQ